MDKFTVIYPKKYSKIFPPIANIKAITAIYFEIGHNNQPRKKARGVRIMTIISFFVVFIFNSNHPDSYKIWLFITK